MFALVIVLARGLKRARARTARAFGLARNVREFALDTMRAARRHDLVALRAQRGVAGTLDPVFRADHGEDLLLWELFGAKPEGVFLEVGANDGLSYSVSYAFEAVGWRGVLIEPAPGPAAHCDRARPGSRVFHAAAVEPGAEGTITLRVPELAPHIDDPRVLSYVEGAEGEVERARKLSVPTRAVEVPARTMTDILDEASPGEIDFAVVDVEGYEPQLLMGWDTDRHPVRAFLIEEIVGTTGEGPGTREILEARGYVRCGEYFDNALYVRRDQGPLIEEARRLLDRWRIWA
ncbi:MAG: FkbM family methyltransferase [Planctomycetota bacterium]